MYEAYKGQVQFFLVYIRKAHPARDKPTSPPAGGRTPSPRDRLAITQHKTLKERMIAADKCMKGMKLTIPILLDTMEGSYLKAFDGFQAGTTVVDINGKIAYWNRGQPRGCQPKNAETALKKLLANGGGAVKEKWADVKVPPDPRPGPTTRPALARPE